MSNDKISIFYTGATGYIGESVLQRILSHPQASTFDITVLVRSAEKAKTLESNFGLKALVGSLEDHEEFIEHAENAHVIISTAVADNIPSMKAMFAGMKLRHDKTGDLPIFIHTSGAAFLIDDSRRSESPAEKVTSDLDVEALEAIPPTAFHHAPNLLVASEDAKGYARMYIVVPTNVYGIASGPLYDAGISKKHSFQIPWFSGLFIQRGRVGIVGSGANLCENVHIDDMADLYYRLFDAALSKPESLGHGRNGYFFVENGETSGYALSAAIGEALVALGVAPAGQAEPTVLSSEERVQYFGSDVMAFLSFSSWRCRSDRGRKELGWAPQYTADDLIKSVHAEVEAVLKKQRLGQWKEAPVLNDSLATAIADKST